MSEGGGWVDVSWEVRKEWSGVMGGQGQEKVEIRVDLASGLGVAKIYQC